MSASSGVDPSAFDAFARNYDAEFTGSILGRLLRRRVWNTLAANFSTGQHVLELACGTGEDAAWLAGRGVCITATDGSAEMLRIATEKVARAGVSEKVATQQASLQEIIDGWQPAVGGQLFDGAFSNFGGLNTISAWGALAQSLARQVRSGGRVVLVPMGLFCPWEILWHAVHGRFSTALRRFSGSAPAQIGEATIPVWYPSARRLRADFAPWFRHLRTESLGLWLPPSYLGHLVNGWPAVFTRLNRLENATARLTAGWGDHYIIAFERKQT